MNGLKRFLVFCIMITLVIAYCPVFCRAGESSVARYLDNKMVVLHANVIDESKFSGEGEGTYADPYRITTPEQLMEIQNNLSAYYYLENDLDMSDIDTWSPIGNGKKAFSGVLDGRGHVIRNLKFTIYNNFNDVNLVENEDNYLYIWNGLFGFADKATIKNLGIEDAEYTVVCNEYYGDYSVYSYLGGVVGGTKRTEISQCYFNGTMRTISGNEPGIRVGGITARAGEGSSINDCSADVVCVGQGCKNDTVVGGIVAKLYEAVVNRCYALGDMRAYNTGGSAYAGGIVGSIVESTVVNCVSLVSNVEASGSGWYGSNANKIANGAETTNCVEVDANTIKARTQSIYENRGWNFDTVWMMAEKHPELRCFIEGMGDVPIVEETKYPEVTETVSPSGITLETQIPIYTATEKPIILETQVPMYAESEKPISTGTELENQLPMDTETETPAIDETKKPNVTEAPVSNRTELETQIPTCIVTKEPETGDISSTIDVICTPNVSTILETNCPIVTQSPDMVCSTGEVAKTTLPILDNTMSVQGSVENKENVQVYVTSTPYVEQKIEKSVEDNSKIDYDWEDEEGEDELEENAQSSRYLSKIICSNAKLSPKFSKSRTTYLIVMNKGAKSIVIKPITEYKKDTVKINGKSMEKIKISLKKGASKRIKIAVSSEKGRGTVYTVIVKRKKR